MDPSEIARRLGAPSCARCGKLTRDFCFTPGWRDVCRSCRIAVEKTWQDAARENAAEHAATAAMARRAQQPSSRSYRVACQEMAEDVEEALSSWSMGPGW